MSEGTFLVQRCHVNSNPFFPTGIRASTFCTINFSDPADKARHDRMVTLVTQMLDLNKRVQDATLDHEKTLLQRQIDATDEAIDKLVYELYGLTEEKNGIVVVTGK